MEAAALYTLAARFGVKALTICPMTDCLITGQEIDADQRQTSLKEMATLALEVANEACGLPGRQPRQPGLKSEPCGQAGRYGNAPCWLQLVGSDWLVGAQPQSARTSLEATIIVQARPQFEADILA